LPGDISDLSLNESLSNVSFNAKEGRVTGIIDTGLKGGSLLLRILSGAAIPASGSLLVNGTGFNAEIASFVPGGRVLPGELTVFDNINFAVRKNISGKTDEELIEITLTTLCDTGLIGAKDHLTEALDPGERKKLNIALGLVTDPHILCIDDPFEGLALHQEVMMMDFLRNIARKGKLVFIMIRKPSSETFGMLDEVLVLDGGYLVFSGTPADAVCYFKAAASRHDSQTGECSLCGCISPEPVFSILDLRVTDESGHATRQRKVMPEEWAALFNSLHPFNPVPENGEKLSGKYTRPPKGFQNRVDMQVRFRRMLSRLKKILERNS
jgi:ABC transport system ATP-binding/permease protein